METEMSDESLPGPSWDPESGRASIEDLTGSMGTTLGFHLTCMVTTNVATKCRYVTSVAVS